MRQDASEDIPVLTADAVYELVTEACERIAFWDECSFPRIGRGDLSERGEGLFVVKGRFNRDDIYALEVVMRRVCERLHCQVRYAFDNRSEYGLPYIEFAWIMCVGDGDSVDPRAEL